MALKKKCLILLNFIAAFILLSPVVSAQEDADETDEQTESEETIEITDEDLEEAEDNLPSTILNINGDSLLDVPDNIPQKFTYDSGVDIEYPQDGVKGIFVTAGSANGEKFEELTNFVNSTELNSMVIDVKEDYGSIVVPLDTDNENIEASTIPTADASEFMPVLEENQIYPIARIVVFKDSRLAEQRPDLSFTNSDGSVWQNNNGESFVNPYEKEVWDYNIEVAKEAAKLGFKEIQFDYVRFPEGFENMDEQLNYSRGEYTDSDASNVDTRVEAVTDFVDYAYKELAPYGVDVSVDIFGYAAMVPEAPGIGQNFQQIASNVDVISSMIYPSHWGPGNLGVAQPDLDPYATVDNYMDLENELLNDLGEDAPRTRPWLQDFTASYLGAGNFQSYGAEEVTEQVQALHDNGVEEFLLWNASNNYSTGAQYEFE